MIYHDIRRLKGWRGVGRVDERAKLRGLEGLLAVSFEHLKLVGYKSHGKIAAPVAV